MTSTLPSIKDTPATLEVPQTIVSDLSSMPRAPSFGAVDIDLSECIHYTHFTIGSGDAIGEKLFEFDTDKVWGSKVPVPPNRWIMDQAIKGSWNWQIIFVYSKLEGPICSYDWTISYAHPKYNYVSHTEKESDSGSVYIFDQHSDSFAINMPWNGNDGAVSQKILSPSDDARFKTYCVPSAKFSCFLREKYKPTIMQPDTIDVVVYLRLVDVNLVGRIVMPNRGFYPLCNPKI